jgi:hypothetical protein
VKNIGAGPAFAASPSSPVSRSRPIGFNPGESPTRVALEASLEGAIIDDVSEVIARTRYIMRYPARLFGKGLASELMDAVDRLNLKVAELRELEDADR